MCFYASSDSCGFPGRQFTHDTYGKTYADVVAYMMSRQATYSIVIWNDDGFAESVFSGQFGVEGYEISVVGIRPKIRGFVLRKD